MKISEIVKQDNSEDIENFIRWVCGKLMIGLEIPEIIYSDDKESEQQDCTGHYNSETNQMWIYTGNRNLVDILRTVAHELSHHKQRLDGSLDNTSIVDLETQSDMVAGMLMKIWLHKHPEIIQ